MLRATAAGDGPLCSAPARARRRRRWLGRCERRRAAPLGAAHPRHDLVAEASQRRAGEGDDPVRGAASEPQAGADAAGQDRARVHLSPRSRSASRRLAALLGGWSSWPRSSWRRSSWPGSSLAGAFLAVAFLAAPSWPGPSSRAFFAAAAQAVPAPPDRRSTVVRPRPLASAHLGGHCAHRGGGRADRRADHLLAGADRVLRGPGDRADHACDGEVRDVLDRAERILRGHWRVLPERGQRTRGRVNHGNQAVRRPSGMGRARRGSCPRAPGRGG